MTYEGTSRQAVVREIPAINHYQVHDLGHCAILRSEWEKHRG